MWSRFVPISLLAVLLVGCSGAPSTPPAPGPASQNPVVTQFGGLTMEEYPIARAADASPGGFEFRELIAPEVFAKRRAWRELDSMKRLETLNEKLVPFDHRLVPSQGSGAEERFDLYRGDQLLATSLSDIYRISASDEDFAFVARPSQGGMVLIRSGSMESWDISKHHFIPPVVIVGQELVTVEAAYPSGHVLPGAKVPYIVTRDGAEAFRFELEERPTSPGVEQLEAWEGRWVVEAPGNIIIDGISLNQQHGYDETFGWQLVADKPFYFFRKDGAYGISYDGAELPHRYADIPHYRCCEPAMFNPGGTPPMVWFYGLKDGIWHYVEVGRYE